MAHADATYADLLPEDLERLKKSLEALQQLDDGRLVMLALAELIMNATDMPIGIRIPLNAELTRRAKKIDL